MPYEDFYEVYKERYNIIKHQREIAKSEEIPSIEKYRLKPNSMQERFIANLRNILEQGEERALLISATGTGKTYASAFAMRELGFKRVLFLVHRVTLAKQAKIFKSIDKIKGMKTLIKESYVALKNRLGRVPLLYDFYENQEIDPLVIIREYKTYYAFMQAMEKDKYKNSLNEQEKLTLEYLSKTLLSGVRPDELPQ